MRTSRFLVVLAALVGGCGTPVWYQLVATAPPAECTEQGSVGSPWVVSVPMAQADDSPLWLAVSAASDQRTSSVSSGFSLGTGDRTTAPPNTARPRALAAQARYTFKDLGWRTAFSAPLTLVPWPDGGIRTAWLVDVMHPQASDGGVRGVYDEVAPTPWADDSKPPSLSDLARATGQDLSVELSLSFTGELPTGQPVQMEGQVGTIALHLVSWCPSLTSAPTACQSPYLNNVFCR